MKLYYEASDKVSVKNKEELELALKDYIKDEKGRLKIIEDIVNTNGIVYAVAENRGHIEVLYRKNNDKHTWKVPVAVFKIAVHSFDIDEMEKDWGSLKTLKIICDDMKVHNQYIYQRNILVKKYTK